MADFNEIVRCSVNIHDAAVLYKKTEDLFYNMIYEWSIEIHSMFLKSIEEKKTPCNIIRFVESCSKIPLSGYHLSILLVLEWWIHLNVTKCTPVLAIETSWEGAYIELCFRPPHSEDNSHYYEPIKVINNINDCILSGQSLESQINSLVDNYFNFYHTLMIKKESDIAAVKIMKNAILID